MSYGKDLIRNLILCTWPRFVGSVEPHLPQAFLKNSFVEAWEQDFDILDQTCRHHLRNDLDVNQWLIRLRQIMEGRFAVRKPLRETAFTLGKDDKALIETIIKSKKPMICLHDSQLEEAEFLSSKTEITRAFECLLPEKSAFEL